MMYGKEMEDNAEMALKAIFLVVTAHCICISIISRAQIETLARWSQSGLQQRNCGPEGELCMRVISVCPCAVCSCGLTEWLSGLQMHC